MTSFIKKIVGNSEHIILAARLHWIYLVQGTAWLVLLLVAGIKLDMLMWQSDTPPLPVEWLYPLGIHLSPAAPFATFTFGLLGAAIFLVHVFKVIGTEIALTSLRIIYKTGVVFVNTVEVDLVEIRAENVHHGLLGRFLGYGRLKLDSRFVGDIFLPAVRDPYRFVKAVNAARAHLHDPMTDDVPGHGQPHGK